MTDYKKTEILADISLVRNKIREWKKQGLSVGFVPTMGALHIGHESLIKKAREENDRVVVSIFVNPIQFGPNEDFEKYPRQLDADCKMCVKNKVELIFAPTPQIMYPEKNNSSDGDITTVVPPISFQDKLCGKSRPGHFNGVATVVLKLFNIVQPDRAYFGQKDAQQLIIIKKMVKDLDIPVEVIGCPIIRESDGLACSSRNTYLSLSERENALCLSKVLFKISELFDSGVTDVNYALSEATKILNKNIDLEYLEVLDFKNLKKIDTLKNDTIILIAAKINKVRLIDNIIL